MKRGLEQLLADESGQAITEYVILLSVVVVAAGAMGRLLMDSLDRGIRRLGGQLEKDLKSGRASLSVWKN